MERLPQNPRHLEPPQTDTRASWPLHTTAVISAPDVTAFYTFLLHKGELYGVKRMLHIITKPYHAGLETSVTEHTLETEYFIPSRSRLD